MTRSMAWIGPARARSGEEIDDARSGRSRSCPGRSRCHPACSSGASRRATFAATWSSIRPGPPTGQGRARVREAGWPDAGPNRGLGVLGARDEREGDCDGARPKCPDRALTSGADSAADRDSAEGIIGEGGDEVGGEVRGSWPYRAVESGALSRLGARNHGHHRSAGR